MEYFEGFAPTGDTSCEYGRHGIIPRGSGYLYISQQAVDFRRNARSLEAFEKKYDFMEAMGKLEVFVWENPGMYVALLLCETCAKQKGLDLEVAAADAKHWWETGEAPLRATPGVQPELIDRTLIDTEAGLMWQKEDDGVQRTHQEALDYCADLTLAGFTDWRLPELSEFQLLKSIGGNTRSQRGGPNSEYWTATKPSHPSIPKDVVGTIAYTSEGLTFSKDEEFYVLAVRQITDSGVSKTGQPSPYAKRETKKKWWEFWK